MGDASLVKNGMAYHFDTTNESVSVQADGNESYFPLDLDVSISEEAIIDLEAFQFAGNFSIDSIDTHGNDDLRHIVDGFVEIAELFENKWIILDFLEVKREFPQLEGYITEMQEEFLSELNSIDGFEELEWLISGALENGYATVENTGNTYVISFLQTGSFAPSTENPLTVTLVSNRSGKLESVAVSGSGIDSYEWSDDWVEVTADVSLNFSYRSALVEFPKVSEVDFDITQIVEMFLEFSEDSIVKEISSDMFYKNLNAFSGNADEAITVLQNSSNPTDVLFVTDYIETAKKMDRRIRLQDIQILSAYGLEDWEAEYLKDDISSIREGYEGEYYYDDNLSYEYKNMFEKLIEITSSEMDYAYIPWDIYDEMDISFSTRGDILIALAKIRQAEMMIGE